MTIAATDEAEGAQAMFCYIADRLGAFQTKKQFTPSKNKFIRYLWISLGSIFVGVGFVGVFVPGLPTTIWLILAAGCYIRSSERLYNWLIENKLFGKYIKNYYDGLGMPRNSKVLAVSSITLFCTLAIIFFISIMWIKILVFFVGISGILFILLKVPTQK